MRVMEGVGEETFSKEISGHNFTRKISRIRVNAIVGFAKKKNVREKSGESHNHKPQHSQTSRGRGNRQIQTSTNRSNVRKALRLALSSPSEVIAMIKGLKKHKNKMAQGKTYNKSPRRINHKAPKSKTNTGAAALERSVE